MPEKQWKNDPTPGILLLSYRVNRSLPVQSQSHLSGIHPFRTRSVRLAKQSVAAGNTRGSFRSHGGGCDPTRRTVPRTQLQ